MSNRDHTLIRDQRPKSTCIVSKSFIVTGLTKPYNKILFLYIGLLWDKPYLSSLKETFEASLSADSSSNDSGKDEIPDIDIDIDSNPRPPIDINIPAGGPVGIAAPGDISPSKPITGGDSDEALTAPNASESQGDFYLLAFF